MLTPNNFSFNLYKYQHFYCWCYNLSKQRLALKCQFETEKKCVEKTYADD